MRVFVTGASGFIGRSFVKALSAHGHDVVAVSRRPLAGLPDKNVVALQTDLMVGGPWQETAAGCDAAITLAGEPISGRRWNDEQKGLIRSSRIRSTRLLVDAWSRNPRPRVLLGCSATHYYGPRPPDEVLDENAGGGDTFLARAMREWEDEAYRATDSGARVVTMRIGVVLGRGGALDYCAPMVRGFLGHIAGTRHSSFSWIHHEDNVGLMLHALERSDVQGPLNMTSPGIVTWSHFMTRLARHYKRPFTVPVPHVLARLSMGDVAELWFSGQHVYPAKALATGYTFKYPVLEPALADVLKSRS